MHRLVTRISLLSLAVVITLVAIAWWYALRPPVVLHVGIAGAVGNVLPLTSFWHPTEFASAAVHRGLLGLDDRGELIPMLATVVPTVENGGVELVKADTESSPQLLVSLVLRPHLRWSDGNRITTEDVAFSFELFRQASFRGSQSVRALDAIEIHDASSVTFRFKAGYTSARLMELFIEPLYPRHILQGQTLSEVEASSFARKPIGAGPFRVTEWLYVGEPPAYVVEGIEAVDPASLAPALQIISMERNPHFFGQAPAVDQLKIHVIPDQGSLLAAMREGRLDLTAEWSPVGDPLDSAAAGNAWTVARASSMRLERLDFNLDRAPLDRVEVRHAIAAAIDRIAIAADAIDGMGVEPAGSWLSTASWAFSNVLGDIDARAAAARRDRSALSDVITDASSTIPDDIRVEMLVLNGNPVRDRVAREVKQDLATIGVVVDIRQVDAGTLLGPGGRLLDGDYDMALYSWQGGAEPDGTDLWHSSSIPDEDNGWRGNNFTGWTSATNDELLSSADSIGSPAERAELYAAQQMQFARDLPSLPLFEYPQIALVSRDLEGFRLPAGSLPSTWSVESWTLTDSAHRGPQGGGT